MTDQDIIDTIAATIAENDHNVMGQRYGLVAERVFAGLRERYQIVPLNQYADGFCPKGCDCSCCYGRPDGDCHCVTYPCNCGGGPKEHGK